MSFDSISPTGIPGLTWEGRQMILGEMKKVSDLDDDLRPYYEFDYSKMKPNRFAGEKKVYKESTIPMKASRKSSRDRKK